LPRVALDRIAGAQADGADVDIAVVNQPARLSGVTVSATGEMGACPDQSARDAAGKLSMYWDWIGAVLLGVVGVDRRSPSWPAFPSVRTTALPINSDCASPYSLKIFDARRFTERITRPCSADPSAAQRRGVFQCSASGAIDGERSNSRSRSICVL